MIWLVLFAFLLWSLICGSACYGIGVIKGRTRLPKSLTTSSIGPIHDECGGQWGKWQQEMFTYTTGPNKGTRSFGQQRSCEGCGFVEIKMIHANIVNS